MNNEYDNSLVDDLMCVFADTFSVYFKAHSFHWNVSGPDFSQYHALFSSVYEDAFDALDPIAENMRKMDGTAPTSIGKVLQHASMVDNDLCPLDAVQMVHILHEMNVHIIDTIRRAFHTANLRDEQGVANFLAERMDAHQKWAWQLGVTCCGSAKLSYGNDAGSDLIMEDEPMMPEDDYGYGHDYLLASVNNGIISFGTVDRLLSEKVERHNAINQRKATLDLLKAVYRRGATEFGSTYRAGATRSSTAMARVDSFLQLLKAGKPSNPLYTMDNDLLPLNHPLADKKVSSLVSSGKLDIEEAKSALDQRINESLSIDIENFRNAESPEIAILALTEFSGMGYDVEAAIRSCWIRAVKAGDNPFDRSLALVTSKYESADSDLLPVKKG